jgi:cell filamentation protein
MQAAESEALVIAQEVALDRFDSHHRFTAEDIRALHRLWLGPIYRWAGEYRSVNISKAGFQFAHAPLVPRLMEELERGALHRSTPCHGLDDTALVPALAEVHGELILIHPFREGNGRLSRLLSLLMALQAGLPPLDYSPIAGRGKRAYIGAIHASLDRNYEPLVALFAQVIARSRRRAASSG